MPRTARIVIPDIPHHITQRGNNGQNVFFVDADRRVYLALLKEQAEKFRLDVLGYCLMTNHVHVIAIPRSAESLAKGIGRAHFRYAQYINRFHGRSGHLWQNRFYSCALDDAHLLEAMRYIERNPIRAKLSGHASDYEWSSAVAQFIAHTGEQANCRPNSQSLNRTSAMKQEKRLRFASCP